MISKAKTKYIKSLELKKNRDRENVFVAEGPKIVNDLLTSMTPHLIIYTPDWQPDYAETTAEHIEVTAEELRKVSFMQHPQQVVAVFDKPSPALPGHNNGLILALDGVQDPGNLGTIIRIADWFGIEHIVCSNDTADAYNPKVVQATMGSIARVRVSYTDLDAFMASQPVDYPIYGTLLNGDNIYGQELTNHGIIVMGNEGKGISPSIRQRINRRLLIPGYPEGKHNADSLNVAVATAITCSEFRRRF